MHFPPALPNQSCPQAIASQHPAYVNSSLLDTMCVSSLTVDFNIGTSLAPRNADGVMTVSMQIIAWDFMHKRLMTDQQYQGHCKG